MTPTLDRLPSEILNTVATSCDAFCALALSATCQQLREITWQPRVFREIIMLQQIPWPPMLTNQETNFVGAHYASEPPRELDLEVVANAAGEDTSAWARIAVANQLANQLFAGREQDLKKGRVQALLTWAPHLALFGHPFVSSAWLAYHLKETMTGEPFERERAFLYAACMTSVTKDGLEWLSEGANGVWQLIVDASKVGTTPTKTYRALGWSTLFICRIRAVK